MRPLQSYHLAWLSSHPERDILWLRAKLQEGFHVHHLDGDHYNDDPPNLLLIDGVDHLRLHGLKIDKPRCAAKRGPRGPTKKTLQKRLDALPHIEDIHEPVERILARYASVPKPTVRAVPKPTVPAANHIQCETNQSQDKYPMSVEEARNQKRAPFRFFG